MPVGHLRSASDHAEYQELEEGRRRLKDEEGSFFNVAGERIFRCSFFLTENTHLRFVIKVRLIK